jgi:hypothetical protein
LKQSAATELISTIRAVATDKNYLDPKITGKIVDIYAEKDNKLRGEAFGE